MVQSENEYQHGHDDPCNAEYINRTIIAALQRLKVRRVLDIGCGNGLLAALMVEHNFEVVGLDPSSSGVEHARAKAPTATFYCLGVYDDPLLIAETDFDAVVCTEVVEHLFDPRALPRFAAAKLKNNGYFLVTTPYHGYLKNLALSLFNKWDFHHTPLWDVGHIKFWPKNTLTQLLQENGFAYREFIGCGRLPYLWKSMLIISQKQAN